MMGGDYLVGSHKQPAEPNIYADRSALVLDWLLRVGAGKQTFSLREVARQCGVSTGLVQKVFTALALHGFIQVHGLRTQKRFSVPQPEALLESWLDHYSLPKKCQTWTYQTGLSNRKELLAALSQPSVRAHTALALHSAAEAHGCKNTNLDTVELYLFNPEVREQLEQLLSLQPLDRGYEVLLVAPYYKSLLASSDAIQGIKVASPLLTFLDLYHFPLRGLEQAEFMAERIPELKRIYLPHEG